MNWSFRYDPTNEVICVQANGRITIEELEAGARTITTIPEFHPDIRVLLDFSRATEVALEAAGLVALAQNPAFSPKSKRAVIAPHGAAWGAFQFYKRHAQPGPAEIFSRRADAINWLNDGVPEDRRIPPPAGSRPSFDLPSD